MNRPSLMNMIRTVALAALAAIPGMCCNYTASMPTIPAGGGPVAIYVNTQAGCTWQITTESGFLSYYGGRQFSGPGYAYVYAAADRGAARTGRVDVMGTISTWVCGPGFGTRTGNCGWQTSVRVATVATATQY